MEKNIIHFFLYMDYEKMNNELSIRFKKPIKDEHTGIYEAQMETPLYFYLPKSKIIDIYQDDHDRSFSRYIINTDEHSELLSFIDNLDLLTLDIAELNSEIWFKKKLEKTKLQNYLSNMCETDDDENVYLDLRLSNLSLIEKIEHYNNINDNTNILVKLESIEFFKKTFKLNVILDDFNIISDLYEDDEVNFDDLIDKNENIMNENKDDGIDIIEKNSISDSLIMNKETIIDLADDGNESDSNDSYEVNDNLIYELESVISEKKKEKQNLLLNSKRAKDTARQLLRQAKITENEIETLSNKLKYKNNIKSISNIL